MPYLCNFKMNESWRYNKVSEGGEHFPTIRARAEKPSTHHALRQWRWCQTSQLSQSDMYTPIFLADGVGGGEAASSPAIIIRLSSTVIARGRLSIFLVVSRVGSTRKSVYIIAIIFVLVVWVGRDDDPCVGVYRRTVCYRSDLSHLATVLSCVEKLDGSFLTFYSLSLQYNLHQPVKKLISDCYLPTLTSFFLSSNVTVNTLDYILFIVFNQNINFQ